MKKLEMETQMKTCTRNLFLPLLTAALGLILAGRLTAQTFTVLHSFTAIDGVAPQDSLILSLDTLYGTTASGGWSGWGSVFSVYSDGVGFTPVYSFKGTLYHDGLAPRAGLILSGNSLFGTTTGGALGQGTVFKVNTDGTIYAILHAFTRLTNGLNTDGAAPVARLTLSGGTLYGTARDGGTSGRGTAFSIDPDGGGFRTLHSFAGYPNDGANPYAGLVSSENILYGTTYSGGTSADGTVFALSTDGRAFTNLYTFTGSDGAHPRGTLLLSGDTLYGTTSAGGRAGNGTVFAIKIDGTGFTNLHNFTALGTNSSGAYTNCDGVGPQAGLILSGKTLYGTAAGGGSSGSGTVFAMNIDGTGLTAIYDFTATDYNSSGGYTNSDGANPLSGLILSGSTLYGTTQQGGNSGYGTLFSLFLPPQLTIIPSGPNVILTWPLNALYTTLQATTNLGPSAVWTTVSSAPVAINDQYTVIKPISGTQQFFRLSQ